MSSIKIKGITLSKVRRSQKRVKSNNPYREVWVGTNNVGIIESSRTFKVIDLIIASKSTNEAIDKMFINK